MINVTLHQSPASQGSFRSLFDLLFPLLFKCVIVVPWTVFFLYPSWWHSEIHYGTWLTLTDSRYSFAGSRDSQFLLPFADLVHSFRFPVHNAAIKGDATTLARALKARPEALTATDNHGLTPLEYAAIFRHVLASKVLLEAGARTEVTNELGVTPLWHALVGKQPAIVKLLLEANARVDVMGEKGSTPMHFAAERNLVDILERIPDHCPALSSVDRSGKTPLDLAIANNHLAAIMVLADKGAPLPASTQATDPLAQVYLTLWKKTGDPSQAAMALAEETKGGFMRLLGSQWDRPAEFPVDDRPTGTR